MTKRIILLLFGGESPEHEVSIISAQNVYRAIDQEKYDVQPVYIDKGGVWHSVDVIRKGQSHDEIIGAVPGKGVISLGQEKIKPDVILPVLHGSNGEDGSVQGFAQLLHIPIVGPSMKSALVTIDKDIAKKLLTAANLPVVDWVVVHKSSHQPSYEAVKEHLGDKLFVKPASAGSSVGVKRAQDANSFVDAVEEAFQFDDKIIIETAIGKAREIEVSVLGNRSPKASTPGEIIPGETFYSYDDKYSDNSEAQVKVPADLSQEIAEQIKQLAVHAYKATEGHGMARVDFFLSGEGMVYINEINTIPGFTNISMYPKLWKYDGLEYSQLIDELIELALET